MSINNPNEEYPRAEPNLGSSIEVQIPSPETTYQMIQALHSAGQKEKQFPEVIFPSGLFTSFRGTMVGLTSPHGISTFGEMHYRPEFAQASYWSVEEANELAQKLRAVYGENDVRVSQHDGSLGKSEDKGTSLIIFHQASSMYTSVSLGYSRESDNWMDQAKAIKAHRAAYPKFAQLRQTRHDEILEGNPHKTPLPNTQLLLMTASSKLDGKPTISDQSAITEQLQLFGKALDQVLRNVLELKGVQQSGRINLK